MVFGDTDERVTILIQAIEDVTDAMKDITRGSDRMRKETTEDNKQINRSAGEVIASYAKWTLGVVALGKAYSIATRTISKAIEVGNRQIRSIRTLEKNLENAGFSVEMYGDRTERLVEQLERQRGLSDELGRTTLSNLLTITNQLGDSQARYELVTRAAALSQDIANSSGQGAIEVSKQLGRVLSQQNATLEATGQVWGKATEEQNQFITDLEGITTTLDKAEDGLVATTAATFDLATGLGLSVASSGALQLTLNPVLLAFTGINKLLGLVTGGSLTLADAWDRLIGLEDQIADTSGITSALERLIVDLENVEEAASRAFAEGFSARLAEADLDVEEFRDTIIPVAREIGEAIGTVTVAINDLILAIQTLKGEAPALDRIGSALSVPPSARQFLRSGIQRRRNEARDEAFEEDTGQPLRRSGLFPPGMGSAEEFMEQFGGQQLEEFVPTEEEMRVTLEPIENGMLNLFHSIEQGAEGMTNTLRAVPEVSGEAMDALPDRLAPAFQETSNEVEGFAEDVAGSVVGLASGLGLGGEARAILSAFNLGEGLLGGLFGEGDSGGVTDLVTSSPSFGSPGGSVPTAQKGARNAGGMMMVGEEGPELAFVPDGAMILPHPLTMDVMGALQAMGVPGAQQGFGDPGGIQDFRAFASSSQGNIAQVEKVLGQLWPDAPTSNRSQAGALVDDVFRAQGIGQPTLTSLSTQHEGGLFVTGRELAVRATQGLIEAFKSELEDSGPSLPGKLGSVETAIEEFAGGATVFGPTAAIVGDGGEPEHIAGDRMLRRAIREEGGRGGMVQNFYGPTIHNHMGGSPVGGVSRERGDLAALAAAG